MVELTIAAKWCAKILWDIKCSGTKICLNEIWGPNSRYDFQLYFPPYYRLLYPISIDIDWFTLVHTGSHWFNSSFLLFFMYIYLYIVLLYPIVRYFDRYRMIRGWSAQR